MHVIIYNKILSVFLFRIKFIEQVSLFLDIIEYGNNFLFWSSTFNNLFWVDTIPTEAPENNLKAC